MCVLYDTALRDILNPALTDYWNITSQQMFMNLLLHYIYYPLKFEWLFAILTAVRTGLLSTGSSVSVCINRSSSSNSTLSVWRMPSSTLRLSEPTIRFAFRVMNSYDCAWKTFDSGHIFTHCIQDDLCQTFCDTKPDSRSSPSNACFNAIRRWVVGKVCVHGWIGDDKRVSQTE